jgi:hypothetical protein
LSDPDFCRYSKILTAQTKPTPFQWMRSCLLSLCSPGQGSAQRACGRRLSGSGGVIVYPGSATNCEPLGRVTRFSAVKNLVLKSQRKYEFPPVRCGSVAVSAQILPRSRTTSGSVNTNTVPEVALPCLLSFGSPGEGSLLEGLWHPGGATTGTSR